MLTEKVLYISSKDNIDHNSSYFTVNLLPIIDLRRADSVTITCLNVQFKNTIYNVSSALKNNKFKYTPTGGGPIITYIIADGAYDLITLDNILQNMITPPRFSLYQNLINKKSLINIANSGDTIHFDGETFGKLIGFSGDITSTTNSQFIESQTIFDFNPFSNVFICASINNTTSSFNGKPTNILDSLPLNGYVINYTPPNPITCSCDSIIGSFLCSIDFWLCDNNSNIISLAGEYWSGKFLVEIFED